MSKPKTSSNVNIPDEIIKQLLTAAEFRMLKNRWQILNYLEEGLSIRKIASKAKVGTDTVVRVARMAEKGDLRKKISKAFPRISKASLRVKTSTPWIFGKSD